MIAPPFVHSRPTPTRRGVDDGADDREAEAAPPVVLDRPGRVRPW